MTEFQLPHWTIGDTLRKADAPELGERLQQVQESLEALALVVPSAVSVDFYTSQALGLGTSTGPDGAWQGVTFDVDYPVHRILANVSFSGFASAGGAVSTFECRIKDPSANVLTTRTVEFYFTNANEHYTLPTAPVIVTSSSLPLGTYTVEVRAKSANARLDINDNLSATFTMSRLNPGRS